MKIHLVISAFLVVTSSLASSAVTNIPNGTFETFSAGLPSNWTYQSGGSSSTIIENSVVSPFTLSYPTSHNAVNLVGSSASPTLYTDFAPSGGALSLSFDFRLGAGSIASGDHWFFDISGGLTFNLLRIGEDGALKILDESPALSISLVRDTWYHLSFDLSDSHESYDVTLTEFGHASQTWIDRTPINGHVVDISRIYIRRWNTNGSIAPLYLDNFSIESTPVPEANTLYLFIFGLLAAFASYKSALTRRCS